MEVDATTALPADADAFFAWPKPRQADLVFDELFVKRTPISEACRGVVTVLTRLKLSEQLGAAREARSLVPLRDGWGQRTSAEQVDAVFDAANLK